MFELLNIINYIEVLHEFNFKKTCLILIRKENNMHIR
jgi:hypothetical protein